MISRERFTLFAASFLMLYFELALIRWSPGHVRVLAYFTNFVLIACFFGFGLGMIAAKSRLRAEPWAAAGLLGVVLVTLLFKKAWVYATGEILIFRGYEGSPGVSLTILPMLLAFHASMAAAFLPFGLIVGRRLGREPLRDYSANLLGSMAGIAVFFVYSWASWPAWSWFLLGMPPLAWFAPRGRARLAALGACALTVILVWSADRGTIWSPYHKIDFAPFEISRRDGSVFPKQRDADMERLPEADGFNLRINDDFYQHAVDLSDAAVARHPLLRRLQTQYALPYRLKPGPRRVLIVGGGTGNDAAAALRHGAGRVDVVEIDPKIAEIGRLRHPERPYDSPRVRLHIEDARHFFQHAQPGYDVVVFALLDSHRLLGTLSSLRLDSYVFTLESFAQAKRLLSPDGIQVVSFALGAVPWIRSRFYEMLRRVYGEEPVMVHEHGYRTIGTMMISGRTQGLSGIAVVPRPLDAGVALPDDDWPFVYARSRSIPAQYLGALAMILAVSFGCVAAAQRRWRLPQPHFFLLGAGFLLLETKNLTTLSLIFGSTWGVNAVVFFSFLLMALLANWVQGLARPVPAGAAYAGLLVSLAVLYALPFSGFAGSGLPVRLGIVGGLSALPVFFSSLIFSHSFKAASDPARALGSNLLGGVFGAAVEYLSMVTGLRFLYPLAAAFYALSLIARR